MMAQGLLPFQYLRDKIEKNLSRAYGRQLINSCNQKPRVGETCTLSRP
jgi:hypothetical protein